MYVASLIKIISFIAVCIHITPWSTRINLNAIIILAKKPVKNWTLKTVFTIIKTAFQLKKYRKFMESSYTRCRSCVASKTFTENGNSYDGSQIRYFKILYYTKEIDFDSDTLKILHPAWQSCNLRRTYCRAGSELYVLAESLESHIIDLRQLIFLFIKLKIQTIIQMWKMIIQICLKG